MRNLRGESSHCRKNLAGVYHEGSLASCRQQYVGATRGPLRVSGTKPGKQGLLLKGPASWRSGSSSPGGPAGVRGLQTPLHKPPPHRPDRGSSTQCQGTLLLESSHPCRDTTRESPPPSPPTWVRRLREANSRASGGRGRGRGSGGPSVSVPACTAGKSREVSADNDWASATRGCQAQHAPPAPEQILTLCPRGLSAASHFSEGPSATRLPAISRLPRIVPQVWHSRPCPNPSLYISHSCWAPGQLTSPSCRRLLTHTPLIFTTPPHTRPPAAMSRPPLLSPPWTTLPTPVFQSPSVHAPQGIPSCLEESRGP